MHRSPRPSCRGGTGGTSYQIFKEWELDRTSIFRGVAGKRGDVFQGVGAVQLKFEIFNETKAYKRKTCLYEMFFSVLKFDNVGVR